MSGDLSSATVAVYRRSATARTFRSASSCYRGPSRRSPVQRIGAGRRLACDDRASLGSAPSSTLVRLDAPSFDRGGRRGSAPLRPATVAVFDLPTMGLGATPASRSPVCAGRSGREPALRSANMVIGCAPRMAASSADCATHHLCRPRRRGQRSAIRSAVLAPVGVPRLAAWPSRAAAGSIYGAGRAARRGCRVRRSDSTRDRAGRARDRNADGGGMGRLR